LIVHELGHLLGAALAIGSSTRSTDPPTYWVVKVDDPAADASASCSEFGSFTETEHTLMVVGGVVVGAGYLAGVIGDRHPKTPSSMLATSLKASNTSLGDITYLLDCGLRLSEDSRLAAHIRIFWAIGLEMARPERLPELVRLRSELEERGRIEVSAQSIFAMLPAKMRGLPELEVEPA
jgi:hypothetical protein